MGNFTYIDLFSGVGGFRQALDKLGGTCVMASEIDKFANQAYEVLYGHKTVGDVTKVATEDVPNHDLLVGGFPCQAFSVAGKRLGFDDTRGTLFFEMARIAKAKQPKVILAENVKGLISHDKGKTLNTIIRTLCDIGYTVDFNVLNSKYFGVPQNRERIFIVAVRDDLIEASPWEIGSLTGVVAKGKKRIGALAGVKTFNFDWPSQEEVTMRLRDILESDVDERFYLSEEKTAKLVAQLEERGLKESDGISIEGNLKPPNCTRIGQRDDVWGADGVAGTLNATDYKQPRPIAEIRPVLTPDRIEKRQNGHRFKDKDIKFVGGIDNGGMWLDDGKTYSRNFKQGNRVYDVDGIATTLTSQSVGGLGGQTSLYKVEEIQPQMLGHIDLKGHDAIKRVYSTEGVSPMGGGHREPKIAEVRPVLTPDRVEKRQNGRRFKDNDEEAFTLTAQDRHGIALGEAPKYRIRKLTPRECFRLQGFPDSEFDKLVEAGISNSQLYKMAGNAVTVNVIEAIGKRLLPFVIC